MDLRHTELPCFYDDRDIGWGEKTRDFCPTQRASRSGIKMIEQIDKGVCKTDKDLLCGSAKEKVKNSGYRIRKLTPKECWRLQGFPDDAFDRARQALNDTFYKGNDRSNSQLYKQAGNSITTDVLLHIFYELYQAMPYLFDDLKVSSYFSGIGAFEVALDRLFDMIQNGDNTVVPAKFGGEKQ